MSAPTPPPAQSSGSSKTLIWILVGVFACMGISCVGVVGLGFVGYFGAKRDMERAIREVQVREADQCCCRTVGDAEYYDPVSKKQCYDEAGTCVDWSECEGE